MSLASSISPKARKFLPVPMLKMGAQSLPLFFREHPGGAVNLKWDPRDNVVRQWDNGDEMDWDNLGG